MPTMTFDRALFLECARGLLALGERMRAFKGARV
jgi:hypothetical protein